jgi:poly(A) polymerase
VIHRGHPFEVATFRSDDAYVDGRRPTGVVFTDARTDVLRRDFTINGLLYDPVGKTIHDYVGGQRDIQQKIVRAIGDPRRRFAEDKLRILRAIRFGARLGYSIEPDTWNAVREMAPQIHQVSVERIQGEIGRILTEGQAHVGVEMLHDSGLLREILPELKWNGHLAACLSFLPRGGALDLALAVLLHDLSAGEVQKSLERLKFSRAEINHAVNLVGQIPRFRAVRNMNTSELKRFFRQPRFEDQLRLEHICMSAGSGEMDSYNYALRKYEGWTRDDMSPAPLISGADLIALGLSPGPLFKSILTQVEDEQLEGRLRDRAEAVSFVTRNFGH